MESKAAHYPVMAAEILQGFEKSQIRVFFDGTLGLGGHAEQLLGAHPEIELYIGCDKDKEALELARQRLLPFEKKLLLVNGSFAKLDEHLKKAGIKKIDGALFDLGVSSLQLDKAEKGFSFMRDGPLDMRMDGQGKMTAAEVVNTWPEAELERIFRDYGEEPRAKQIAKLICEARRLKRIETTQELVQVITSRFERGVRPKLHAATLVFQALRICVNEEFEDAKRGLELAIEYANTGSVIGVISFHSLEDKVVKECFKKASFLSSVAKKAGEIAPIALVTKKPLLPSSAECRKNVRSRSAKLRFIKKN